MVMLVALTCDPEALLAVLTKYTQQKNILCVIWCVFFVCLFVIVICLFLFFSTLKSKELSPVIGHKPIQVPGPVAPPSCSPQSSSQSPLSTEHSPHTLRKGLLCLYVIFFYIL